MRFRELDGLRGVAALSVVLYHFTDEAASRYPDDPSPLISFPAGEYGVQLFFLISGFVILMSAGTARVPSDFTISRATRLYPAYWVSLAIAVVVASWANVPDVPLDPNVVTVNLTMVQRWFNVPNVLDVYWTLAVEMQFYVLLFLLLLLTRCRLSDRLMTTVAASWLFASLTVAIWAFPASHDISPQFVSTPVKTILNVTLAAYGPLFCTGMLAFRSRRDGSVHWLMLPAACIATLTTGLLQTWSAAAWVGGVCLVFLVVAMRPRTRLLTIFPLQWLGRISYSLYLLHAAIGYALIHALWPFLGRPAAVLVAVAASLGLSWVVYEVVEKRMSSWLRGTLVQLRDQRAAQRTP